MTLCPRVPGVQGKGHGCGGLPPGSFCPVFCFESPFSLRVCLIPTLNVENSSRDGNTRPPDLPPEKPVCGSGKIPHAVEQLNPCATTIEPTLQSLCFTAREATAMRNPCISTKSSPHLVQIEKARVHQQRPSATKKKKKKKETG